MKEADKFGSIGFTVQRLVYKKNTKTGTTNGTHAATCGNSAVFASYNGWDLSKDP